MKNLRNIFTMMALMALAVVGVTSCNDEPDDENYYTFTGEMMSEFLQNNPQYSMFASIVERGGMMDQLSAYGKYTLFAPNNDAVGAYLAKKNRSLESLSAEECDTIARIHLIPDMYYTSEMREGTLTQNMMGRNVDIRFDKDENQRGIVIVNDIARTYYELQDDSVENGVVHPVNAVIENSNKAIGSKLSEDPAVSIYSLALKRTGLDVVLEKKEDPAYTKDVYKTLSKKYDGDYVTGSRPAEACEVPRYRKYGFTLFAVKDDVLKSKYASYFTGNDDVYGLYKLACDIYDPVYPQDVDKAGHSYSNLQDSINPLRRFLEYHILNRNVQGYNLLTVKQDAGIDKTKVNPTEWHETLLPYTMVKVDHLTCTDLMTFGDIANDYYLNRRYEKNAKGGFRNTERGIHVEPAGIAHESENGFYFYIDDVLKADAYTLTNTFNTRIRMDFSTIFPEIMNNNLRMTGKELGDANRGTNYILPPGYLDNVKTNSNTTFIYWYPRSPYYSMHGDEFDAIGEFDIEFNLPPVPFSGDWQIRLGCAPMNPKPYSTPESSGDGAQNRGQVQVYIDGISTGLPVDFSRNLADASGVTGTYFNDTKKYTTVICQSDDEKSEDQRKLKNLGFYRGPNSVFSSDMGTMDKSSWKNSFADMKNTARVVLKTLYLEAGKTHRIRLINVSTVLPKKKEAMLDYLELVPSSVYKMQGDDVEDDL